MVPDLHAECACLPCNVPPDPAHTENSQNLALGIVAEGGQGIATPLASANGLHAGREVAQRSQDQEDGQVGGCVVDGRGRVGDEDGVGCASGDVNLIIARACRLQSSHQPLLSSNNTPPLCSHRDVSQ